MKYKVIEISEITKEIIEKMLDEAYKDGYKDGYNAGKTQNSPTITNPPSYVYREYLTCDDTIRYNPDSITTNYTLDSKGRMH